MAEDNLSKIAQRKAKFPHTCFLYSPVKRDTSNNPCIAFLPETGPVEGGTFGSFKFGRVTKKELLTTKYMAQMDFWSLLKKALSDVREGHIAKCVSALECAIQRLNDFDAAKETVDREYGRATSEIFLLTVENEIPDQLCVDQGEPGSCVVC